MFQAKHIRKYLSFCIWRLALAFSLAGSCLPAFARELRIGTIDVPPFGMRSADNKPSGIMYEISNRIAEEAGFTYTNTLLPYARTSFDLEDGSIDFVVRFNNEELPKISHQLVAVVSMPSIIVARRGTTMTSLADLHGKTVGILRGGQFDGKFATDNAIKKYGANDYVQILRMLQAGRLDAAIGSNVGLYYSAGLLGIKPDELSEPLLLGKREFILHFTRKFDDEETMKALVAATEKLKRSGEIKRIIEKYLKGYQWDTPANSRAAR